jgi:hypothetical protein
MSVDRLAEQKARLLPSTYARLFENLWVTGEDSLASIEELRALVTHDGPLEPASNTSYLIGVDLGLKRDRTAVTVAHRAENRVVLDRIAVWQGSRLKPVNIEEVETWILEASKRYNRAHVVGDPWQAVGMFQSLRSKGVKVDEYAMTSSSTGRLAATLFNAIRDGALALPADEELIDELAHVRLRETSPSVFKMENVSGRHDDRAVALGLVTLQLLSRPAKGQGAAFLEVWHREIDGRTPQEKIVAEHPEIAHLPRHVFTHEKRLAKEKCKDLGHHRFMEYGDGSYQCAKCGGFLEE